MDKPLKDYLVPCVLRPDTLLIEIENLCNEAIANELKAICIPPPLIAQAKQFLSGIPVNIATVVGFPYGYNAIESKLAEILLSIVDGVDEIDMVINILALKNNDWQYLGNEINSILPIVKRKGKVLKVNIEAAVLTETEIIKCCDIYGAAQVDFIQTATGLLPPVSHDVIRLIRNHLADQVEIDASGAIKSYSFAKECINSGAQRVSSTWGLEIVREHLAMN